MTARRT